MKICLVRIYKRAYPNSCHSANTTSRAIKIEMGGRINRSSNETGKALGNTRVPYELEIYCNHAGSLFCCFVFTHCTRNVFCWHHIFQILSTLYPSIHTFILFSMISYNTANVLKGPLFLLTFLSYERGREHFATILHLFFWYHVNKGINCPIPTYYTILLYLLPSLHIVYQGQ